MNEPVIPAPDPDATVPFHFSRPARESRAWESGTALVRLADDVVTVSGSDRLTWLHAITSQQFTGIVPGLSVEGLILTPEGRIAHAFGAVDDGDTVWLVTESGRGAQLAAFLDSMRFASRVEVAHRADLAVVAIRRAAPAHLAAALATPGASSSLAVWDDPWPVTTGTTYGPADAQHPASSPDAAWDVRKLVVADADAAAGAWQEAGGELAGMWTYEAFRVAAWRPRLAREVDERTVPHELDWLRTAVHMHKGCYRGQETVARVVNLGKPPRRLVFLHLDGSAEDLPDPGAAVSLGGRAVGRVTSAARHHELGPIALAVVKRNTDPAATLLVEGHDGTVMSAAQTSIVDPAGRSADTPETRPGAELRRSGISLK